MEVEQARYGPELRLEVHVPEEALDACVPRMLLQPLVENAVRHGVAPRPEGGKVTITAALDGRDLVLRVEDDGPGADPHATSEARGYGLRALRQRLQAMYGPRSALEVDTAPGGGFRATVRLPEEWE